MMFIKIILFLFIVFICAPSHATPCAAPAVSSGWSQTFNNTQLVNGFVYDQQNKILFTIMQANSMPPKYQTIVNWFFNVPSSVVQAWGYSKTPDSYYKTGIVSPHFHSGLLTEDCVELLAENGAYLWSE